MNWKDDAIEKLELYPAKKQSLRSIPEEIARLESDAISIRGITTDSPIAKRRGNAREDMF